MTCSGDLSRNRQVGLRLGAGESLEDIVSSMCMVAEGVKTTQAVHRLAQRLGRRAAELIIVPEFIEDLLFLHVGRELLLLEARHKPLHIQQVAVACLRVAVGAGALALELQLAAAARGEVAAQRFGALAQFGQAALMHLQGLLQLLRAGLGLLDLGKAGRAVAGHFLKEVVDLLRRARDGLALGVQRRRLRPQAGQLIGQFLTAAVKRAAAQLAPVAYLCKLPEIRKFVNLLKPETVRLKITRY